MLFHRYARDLALVAGKRTFAPRSPIATAEKILFLALWARRSSTISLLAYMCGGPADDAKFAIIAIVDGIGTVLDSMRKPSLLLCSYEASAHAI
jgi:hypothetical protein